jgi:hypothetical protein
VSEPANDPEESDPVMRGDGDFRQDHDPDEAFDEEHDPETDNDCPHCEGAGCIECDGTGHYIYTDEDYDDE